MQVNERENTKTNKKPIRGVLVGCGGISGSWLKGLTANTDLNLAGLVDINIDAANMRKDQYSLTDCMVSDNLDALLKAVQPDIVFIATTPESHAPIAITALTAGSHVLSEKPLTNDLQSAQDMIICARKQGKFLGVCQNRRFSDDVRTVKRLIDSGAIGKCISMNCCFHHASPNRGHRIDMPHAVLWDFGPHHFDQARLFCGQIPESVYAEDWRPDHAILKNGPFAQAIVRFSEGVRFSYNAAWGGPNLDCSTDFQAQWRIIGNKGTIIWHGPLIDLYDSDLNDNPRCTTIKPEPGFGTPAGGREALINDFVEAVCKNSQPAVPASDSYKSLAIVGAAIQSAETGQAVRIHIPDFDNQGEIL